MTRIVLRVLGLALALAPAFALARAPGADACIEYTDDRAGSSAVCGVERAESAPYATWWVRAHTSTKLWPDEEETIKPAANVAPGQFFRVEAPQRGFRLNVWDPRSNSHVWVGAEAVGPVDPPDWADFTDDGRWLDVSLNVPQNITAYQGDMPVYNALVTAGLQGTTSAGFYRILRRVANETMDSRRAPGVRDSYLLTGVLYTQYFTFDGAAIHYNWWGPPYGFGRPGSHGCLGMLLNDSKFLWEWAHLGTPIVIHH